MRTYKLIFFLMVSIICNYEKLIAQSCLISHYKFDGNANDSKGTNHGTNNGASLTADRFGNPNSAYQFIRNQSDYISIPFSPFALPNYTYSVWIKLTSLPSSGSAYIFLSVGGTGGDQNMQIENNQNNASLGYLTGFSLTTYNANSSYRMGNASGILPSTNKWYNVVCTRDTNYIKIYVDGCLKAVSASSDGGLPYYGSANQAASIGCRNNNSIYVDAVMDDVKIFGCALNATEIYNLYNPNNKFVVSKDTTFCAKSVSGLKLKASSNYCSYKWIDIKNRKVTLSTDSFLNVSISNTTTYRVYNQLNDSATVTVTLNNLIRSLGRDTSFCPIFTHNLDASNLGNKYLWNTGDTTKQISIDTFGTYIVKVYNNGGCFVIDKIVISQKNVSKISIGNDTTVCGNFNLKLGSNTSGNKYLWNTGDTTQNIFANLPGQYILKLTLSNLCTSEDTININSAKYPKVHLGNDTAICGQVSLKLIADNGGNKYLWSNNDTTMSILVNSAGIYSVQVTNQHKCKSYDTINISKKNIPKLNLGNDTNYCSSFSRELLACDSGLSYQWNTGENTKSIQIKESGVYSVNVSFGANCVLNDTIIINQSSPTRIYLGNDSAICKGKSIVLQVNLDKSTIIWNGTMNGNSLTINTSGTYIVKVTDSNNCVSYDTIVIDVKPGPLSRFTINQSFIPLNPGIVKINNFANGYKALKYLFGDGTESDSLNPWHKYNKEGFYNIKQILQDSFGCADSSELSLTIYDDFKMFVPQTFTPNEDGINDAFKPVFTGTISDDYELQIFNRWGELLFVTNNINEGWDGTYKGEHLNNDMFMYLIKLRTSRRIIRSFSGTFYILK